MPGRNKGVFASKRCIALPAFDTCGESAKSQFLKDRLLLYKNFTRFSFFIFCTETFSAIDDLTVEVTKIDPGALVTYRNGSYNNPYVRYPMQDNSEVKMTG